jgi:creatinine amidohydrolase
VAGVSSNGVLGDPTTADPAAGAAIVERWTASLERHIIEFMDRQ